ncbi:MAG: family 43 glycosylhydrolase [Bacteroidales bacterium]|nr:family 43 glycosylhydrolase [Bacteroidales bacterium]
MPEIRKLLKKHDSAVYIMDDWMRDPYIMIGPDGFYYLTCTQQAAEITHRPAVSNGIPIYRSSDLAKWEYIGTPYTIDDAANCDDYVRLLKEKGNNQELRLWAPELYFIKGMWCAVHTSNVGLGNFILSEGMFSEESLNQWGEKFGRQHDPSLFQDDDGIVWLVSRCTQIQKLNTDLSGFEGDPVSISPSDRKMGHEGALIIKFEGKYILFGTAWSTDTMRKGTYNLYYTTADRIEGPYGPRRFAGRFLGHGTPFRDKEGRWWCTAFYNANVPPLGGEEAKTKDLSGNAYTINRQGLTLVPIEITMKDGDVVVYAKDEYYRYPGPEEVQRFGKEGKEVTR